MTEIELYFKIGNYNGTMRMTIFINDVLIEDYKKFDSEHVVFKHNIPWPSTMKILLTGKNLSCDTKVDPDGKILADKFIELKKILVDRCEATVQYTKSIHLNTKDQSINSVYWGFNGSVTLIFDQDDSFIWHMLQRKDQEQTYVINQTKI